MTEGSHGCPVCRDARRQAVVTQNGLGVVRCLRCGQRYVWPIPSDADLAAIYDPAYYRGGHGSVGFSDYAALTPARRQMFSRHLDRIERLLGMDFDTFGRSVLLAQNRFAEFDVRFVFLKLAAAH